MLLFTKTVNKIKNIEHDIYLKKKRRRLKHLNPTIISNNCVGGVISHDLGQRFCSPTVNLFFKASDFVKFVSRLPHYLLCEVKEVKCDLQYPIGIIDDITVHFLHYNSFDEAKEKWDDRKKRVDYNNLYVMMTEREECNEDVLRLFDSLPLTNKVVFTHNTRPDISCSYQIKGFENGSELGIITDPKPTFWKRRYIDDFDYVSFLNQ